VLTPNFTRRDLQDVTTPKALTHGRELAEHIEPGYRSLADRR